jgi:hypothetical protein
MMREYDTIMCLFNGPKKLEDSQGDSRVRGGFKFIPTQFRIQRHTPPVEGNGNK